MNRQTPGSEAISKARTTATDEHVAESSTRVWLRRCRTVWLRTLVAQIRGGLPVLTNAVRACAMLTLSANGFAQSPPPPPPPPPEPSDTSMVGDIVTNPMTGMTTTVSGLIVDPTGTPTEGATAFVQTADGYAFLVKDTGEIIYNNDAPPVAFVIVGPAPTAGSVLLDPVEDVEGAPPDATAEFPTVQLDSELQMSFNSMPPDPVVTDPEIVDGASGVRRIRTGVGGRNGRTGALFVPPTAGGNGATGPEVDYTNSTNISTTNQIGIEASSRGGNGGRGGDSVLSFWSGRSGGNGGAGGPVEVINNAGIQVATTGNDRHGIYANSRSGRAGNGGDGILAPTGGAGGAARSGGRVTVTNNGNIITTGSRAWGIYALSQSSNGGNGGSQWGLVGASGNGYPGGDGGPITVNNNGSIRTTGSFGHGILGLSVGGTGGASGDSGNLILALPGQGDAGGAGGTVTVNNSGLIDTGGDFARGIFAQSIGGGGGSGGASGGLISIGGAGDGGGNSSTVTVTNNASGSIRTSGTQSDAIFAQSVGGSGGSGSSGGGLVAIGGGGSAAGNGGQVDVFNFGSIDTGGEQARGIVAQSIGGGGGDGGNTGGLVSVGGRGSGAGAGGVINVTNTGSINTLGDFARGVFAQSVGGGGGSGGSTGGLVAVGGSGSGGGAGGAVSITQGGQITTAGRDATAVFAQSVGGGGGDGGSADSVSAFVGVAVGGDGGGGGRGGDVNVTLQGQSATQASVIRTGLNRSVDNPYNGDRSSGLFIQSVGGGGGNGGGTVQVTGGFVGAVSVAVGGDGGIGGAGGTVTAQNGGGLNIIETAGDDAAGAFFQSVGGGGGNGGYAVTVTGAGGPGSGSLSIGVGGRGNAGGAGGEVRIGTFDAANELEEAGLSGTILTTGDRSTGLIAQSVGGGGGNGGIAVASSVSVGVVGGAGIAIGVGGDGGAGGAGGVVSVGTEGNVTTEGDFSSGMLVQSVGGGGGNGGGSIAASLAGGGGAGLGISVGIGGDGGSGNAGGTVTLATRSGTVNTRGESSTGITAQSVGGGGGNGGYSVAVGLGGGGTAAGAVAVGLGGDGGSGGNGGTVNADLESNVLTNGINSSAIVVQSVGGGGGNGGFNVSAGGAIGGTGAGTVGVGLGGGANAGGTGGIVNATSTGVITTRGENSSGFVAQSVGGGGGNGGFNVSGTIAGGGTGSGAVSVGLGGAGGAGSAANNVTAVTSGDVTTEGANSTGILAQSVGGGGGNGGFNVSVALSGAGTGSGAVGVGLGGSGDGGGAAGEVDLTVSNNTETLSDDSNAIVAQSIGGGGGNGAFNVSVTGTGAGTGAVGVGVGIGGSGAGGGSAARVDSVVTGDVTTGGNRSNGLLVQSVGGGGGSGGFNVTANISVAGTASGGIGVGLGGSGATGSNGGPVDSVLTGDVVTRGESSSGVIAQSLGGGGGNGAFNVTGTVAGAGTGAAGVSVGLGGTGGGGGNALRVDNRVTGDVTTMGSESTGVLAQSLGGGGGNGGVNVSGAITGSSSGAGALSVGLGGSGGNGGNAGVVDSDVIGNVTTSGVDSFGVVAQSLGGGGGNGAVNVTANVVLTGTSGGNVGVGIGGAGGNGGTGADVLADVTGNVSTSDAGSGGFLAQSVGGGGGNGGVNVTGGLTVSGAGAATVGVGVGGLGGDGGESGNVTANLTGDVATSGDESYGVLNQSVGGGGGNGAVNVTAGVTMAQTGSGTLAVGVGGFGGNASNAGTVTSTVDGNVTTNGADAFGVMAQSLGGGGGNGGVNVAGALNMSLQASGVIAAGVGGFGGLGGSADTVMLTRTGLTSTVGANSDGVVAQSIGGGGGQGGLNVSAGIAGSTQGAALAGALGLGGFGGSGGNAGDVTANVTGSVLATGFESEGTAVVDGLERREILGGSNGVVAQSVGGSGGNGGVNVSGGIAMTTPSAGATGSALTLGIGGFGGGAGDAGEVMLDVVADVVTAVGDGKSAAVAQSIGGGGGNGGINVSGGVVLDGALTVGVGGSGGGGGFASAVTSDVNATNISAVGAGARGVLAQSVGGGGGNGGINVSGGISLDNAGQTSVPSLVYGMGGEGGAGNVSGDVTAMQTGNVTVDGVDSIGVLVQSVAGGGGSGGLNVSGSLNAGEGFAAVAGVGGTGGSGADAGAASLTSNGVIDVTGIALADIDVADDSVTRFGDRANGILVQSVGGGGGQGGANISGLITRGSAVTVGVGGSGGGGGDAGVVTVIRGNSAAALLQTRGDQANGLTAQSIGGGGGDAGMNLQFALSSPSTGTSPVAANIAIGGSGGAAGDGAMTTVTHEGTILTDGRQSVGIMAQSVGGGGGNANLNVAGALNKKATALNLAVGGSTDDGGDGAAVNVTHGGDIQTLGDDSAAIFAQSVGGGGGNAAMNLATAFGTSNALDIGIGRTGGQGGTGGAVGVIADGNLMTAGDRATGILAQSVGGGGGTSGATSVGVSSSSGEGTAARSSGANVSVGLTGGTGGAAQAATVTSGGLIVTEGTEAHGIHAQSVGGGGGTGGAATNVVFRETTSLRVGVGGMGGDGGTGGIVSVVNDATVATGGERAHGVYAQSVGGGGGTGGLAAVLSLQAGGAAANGNNSVAVSVGGDGGFGVAGGDVTVSNSGVVQAIGNGSAGIAAQSIGGGGGDGGMVLNGAVSGEGRNSALSLGVGGSAGMGGTGSEVTVTNDGTIVTMGTDGIGIRAQSIGGGGGNAGLVANIDLVNDDREDNKSRTFAFNIGGSGGMGGTGGDVTVTNRDAADGSAGMIVTDGENAYGILAQSIGGGGGNGSAVVTGRTTGGGDATLTSLNVGGSGDMGGTAGTVTVNNEAIVDTTGTNAHGIVAQSIGGGGGNGGMVLSIDGMISSLNPVDVPGDPTEVPSERMLSVGGIGGDGGNAGDVVINNSGQIVTRGSGAHGVLAQSIGGGGGNAGVNEGENTYDELAGLVDMIVGGSGSDGGLGGEVTVNHSGDISVYGEGAQAIKAESINGGGGSTDVEFDGIAGVLGRDVLSDLPGVDLLPTFQDEPALETRVGGEQQTNTVAANVTINNTGTFGAFGDNGAGSGVLGVGGGGGTATVNINLDATGVATPDRLSAIDVTVDIGGIDGANNAGSTIDSAHEGDVQTTGLNSHGLAIQSIGGGGGRANYLFSGDETLLGALDFRVGGTNGANDTGGAIDHRQEGNIVTTGNLSHGLLVSSIGGGGGSLALSLDFDEDAATPDTQSVSDPGANVQASRAGRLESTRISLGSSGGSVLDGSSVDVDYMGAIATSGDSSVGIVLQSIGSGGGEVRSVGADGLEVALGGSNGASGNGGDVGLLVRESVNTSGDRAHGVVLQSIGGGGGALFTDTAPSAVTLSNDNVGDGGRVTAILLRDIVTQGPEAHGIIAQSLGGGGGFVDGAFSGSAGGDGAGSEIDLELAGDAMAVGAGSSAIVAQSIGSNGGGDIRISIAEDRMIIGGTDGSGISLDGGADNLVINRGLLSTMDGVDGLAVEATGGNDVIENLGRLVGDVDLGDGTNALSNEVDALFDSGARVNLGGPGSVLSTAGTMSVGGRGRALETQLDGDFVQTDTGLFFMELDFATDAMDALFATGDAALDGSVTLDRLNTQLVRPGDFVRTVIQGDNGFTNDGVDFNFAPSVVVPTRFVETANSLNLEYSVNFAPTDLGRNRSSLGEYLNRLQTAGSSPIMADTIIDLVAIGDFAEYEDALTQLSPDVYAEQLAQTLTLSQEFLRSVAERCDSGDAYGVSQGDNCAWLRYDVKDMERDANAGFPAFKGDSRRFSAGLQHKLTNGDVFGVGVAFDDADLAGFGNRWATSGRTWQLSAVRDFAISDTAKIYLQGSVGESLYDTRRSIDVTDSFVVDSERDVFFVNAVLGVSEQWRAGGLRFKPGIDLGSTYVRADAFSEVGAIGQNLLVRGQSTNHLWITPSLEVVGGERLLNGVLLEGFGRVGVNHYLDDPNTRTSATLSGAIGNIGNFQALSDLDRTHGIFSVGVRAVSDRLRFSLTYDHDQSDNRTTSGVNGKFVLAW